MHTRTALLAAFLVGIVACDPAEPAETGDDTSGSETSGETTDPTGDETTETTGDTGASEAEVEASIVASHGVGPQIVSEGEASAQLAAEAVEFATAFVGSGSLVTTGTVRQQGAQLTYGPSPADALVVDVDGVPTATFQIEAMEGDLSSAANFLGGNHDFRYAVAVDDRIDMRFTSLRSSGSFETSAAGAMVVNALDLEVDVSARGTYFSEVDSTGSEFRNAFSTTGTVDGPGFELALDETWDFQLVTVSGADGGSAQSAVRTVDSSLTLGADTYDWVDVRTQKSYRDGRPSSLDTFWTAQGEVLRNGQAFGQYRLDVDLIDPESGGFILFMLDLPEDSYELERIAAY